MRLFYVKTLILAGLFAVASSSQAGFLEDVNSALGSINQVLGAVNGNPVPTSSPTSTPVPQNTLATATNEQLNKMAEALNVRSNNLPMNQAIVEARENITKLLLVGGCQSEVARPLAIGSILSPSAFVDTSTLDPAMHYTRYHPSDRCMTVENIGEWNMPALNALEFVVVYVSDVSGEAQKRKVEMIKENGKWLVIKHRQDF